MRGTVSLSVVGIYNVNRFSVRYQGCHFYENDLMPILDFFFLRCLTWLKKKTGIPLVWICFSTTLGSVLLSRYLKILLAFFFFHGSCLCCCKCALIILGLSFFFFFPSFIAAFVSMFSLSVFVAEHLSSSPFKCLPVNMTVHKHDTCPFVCRYMHIYIYMYMYTYILTEPNSECGTQPTGVDGNPHH